MSAAATTGARQGERAKIKVSNNISPRKELSRERKSVISPFRFIEGYFFAIAFSLLFVQSATNDDNEGLFLQLL